MARVLVTGINGFIGSHLAQLLLEKGDHVVGLVRPTADLRSLEPLSDRHGHRLQLVVGDLRTGLGLAEALEGVEVVFHLGAVVMGTSEAEFRKTNFEGTRKLVETVMARRGPGFRRFLFTSSQAAAGPAPSPAPIDETAPRNPVSWYGKSKYDAEDVVMEFARQGLPVTIVRPVAVYGERETDISRGTFPAVLAGLRPRVGLRQKTVSLVYVGDLVRGMVAAASSPVTIGKTYFLANPQTNTASELVDSIARAMGKRRGVLLFIPHALLWLVGVLSEWLHHFTRARPLLTRDKVRELRQTSWAASAAAAQRDFSWVATVPLDEGMKAAVADWKRRQREASQITAEVPRDRAIKTFTLSTFLGILVEGLATLAHWYVYTPGWLIFLAMFGFFGVVLGGIAYLLAGRAAIVQFLAGAAAFLAVEIPNQLWLHLWHFSPALLDDRNPWLRAGLLAIPMGLVPLLINGAVRLLYAVRRRLG
jgi:nucleoside-diphosphate-sugar epimerase